MSDGGQADGATLETQPRNRSALVDITEVMSDPDRGLKAKIEAVLSILADRSGFPVVYLANVDDVNSEFLVVEDELDLTDLEEGESVPIEETYCQYVVTEGSTFTELKAGDSVPRDERPYQRYGFEHYVGIPVSVHGNVYGSLCLADLEPRETGLSDATTLLIRIVSAWIGHEIERIERERYTSVLERVLRHNLRNSLTVIQGYSDSLPAELADQRSVRAIQDEVQSLLDLAREAQEIDNLVASETPLERIEVSRLLTRIAEKFRRADTDAEIEVRAPPGLRVLAVSQLRLALEELVENAIQHSDRLQPNVRIVVEERPTTVQISVTDDGPGIPAQEARIIEDGQEINQLRHGSGLGLWLVRTVVQQSNGRLSFGTNEPRGSIVRITLATP